MDSMFNINAMPNVKVPSVSGHPGVMYSYGNAGILSGLAIKEYIKRGDITITPFDEKRIGTNSYDVSLGNTLLTYILGPDGELNTQFSTPTVSHTIPPEGFRLEPGVMYLGHVAEFIEHGNFVPFLDGRSSTGRLSVSLHQTAGRGDIAFRGRWTLEITVTHPVRVYPGDILGQVYFFTVVGPFTTYDGGKYQDAQTVEASKLLGIQR